MIVDICLLFLLSCTALEIATFFSLLYVQILFMLAILSFFQVSNSELFGLRSMSPKFAFTLAAPFVLVAVTWALTYTSDVGQLLLSVFN